MTSTKITLALNTREFDLIRNVLRGEVERLKGKMEDISVQGGQRKATREAAAECQLLLDRIEGR